MRLRKKKNLNERLENVKEYLIVHEGSDFYYNPERKLHCMIDIKQVFGNDNKVYLELGCGKGKFVCDMAELNPDINFIALEKVPNVIVSACEQAQKRDLKNVRFICGSAENLLLFLQPQTVSKIYLNFSCPYPKHTYANHRLTNPKFLKIYRELMLPGSLIEQKTDNKGLFEYSIEMLSKDGWTLQNISLDLHNSNFEGNVMTEYESNFVSQGLPIFRLEAFLK